MVKSMTLKQFIPEVNDSQWSYLAYILEEQLELSFVQRDKLECLLGVTIKL